MGKLFLFLESFKYLSVKICEDLLICPGFGAKSNKNDKMHKRRINDEYYANTIVPRLVNKLLKSGFQRRTLAFFWRFCT